MPDASRFFEEVNAQLEEQRQYLLLEAQLGENDPEMAWVNKHLDLAFEGRTDYVRPYKVKRFTRFEHTGSRWIPPPMYLPF